MAIARPKFYPSLPLENIPFFKQRFKFRTNHDSLFAIATSSYQDGTPPKAGLTALAYGEEADGSRRRFRLKYKKAPSNTLTVQKNIGNDSNEDWQDLASIGSDRFRISDDGVVTATAFYSTGTAGEFVPLTVKESDFLGFTRESFSPVQTITFDRESFYLIQRNDPKEVIVGLAAAAGAGGPGDGNNALGTFDEFGSGATETFSSVTRIRVDTDSGFYLFKDGSNNPVLGFKDIAAGAGAVGPPGPAGPQGPQGPGFYLTAKQYDDLASFSGLNLLSFGPGFYLTQNAPNTDEVQINLRVPEGPTGPTGPAGPPGAAGAGFYFTVKQSDDKQSFSGINVVSVEALNFYVTQNAGNTDEVQINLRGRAAGEANTASNLGGGEGVYASKSGVDLRFKSITAGANVNLSSDSDEITIAVPSGAGTEGVSTLDFINQTEVQFAHNLGVKPLLWNVFDDADEAIIPNKVDISNLNTAYFYFDSAISGSIIVSSGISAGAGTGFYGNTVKQTDGLAGFSGIKVFNFGPGFYLTQNVPNTDEVVINLRGDAGGVGPQGPQGPAGPPGPGFYLVVKHSDDSFVARDIQVIAVNVDGFYLSKNPTNPDEVIINLRDAAGVVTPNRFHSQDFGSSLEWQVAHNLNTTNLVWAAYDGAKRALIPGTVDVSNPNISFFYFEEAVAGTAVVSATGGPTTAVEKYTQVFGSSVEWVVTHNLGEDLVGWWTYDTGKRAIIPNVADISNPNTAYFYFGGSIAGTAVIVG